jgi:lipoprotein-anchoring transpeptidase ErfK/SrfK
MIDCIQMMRWAKRAGILLVTLTLAACVSVREPIKDAQAPQPSPSQVGDAERYAAVTDGGFQVPAVTLQNFDPRYRRQLVNDTTGERPGTIVVDPKNRFLYLVQKGGTAFRYGVGVGREGMAWSGTARVAYKRKWPRWTPTQDMIARDPGTYRKWANGMEGGTDNPLGARALYLFEGGKDTLYRIHGTNQPASIGRNMSSGCIRMMNQDVIDLYNRVPDGAKVVVLPVGEGVAK